MPRARYALVVSLRVSEEVEADIYTPVVLAIGLPAIVDIDINGRRALERVGSSGKLDKTTSRGD